MWVKFEDVQEMHTAALSADADQARVEGLIRRAERSLVKLLLGPSATPGDLAGFDRDTVVDVVVDAVSRRLHNPHGYVSETAGEYSYRFEKGSDGFWWPEDWRLLGSSPLARGGHPVDQLDPEDDGLIPAGAGRT